MKKILLLLFVSSSFTVTPTSIENNTLEYETQYAYNQDNKITDANVTKATFLPLPENKHFGLNNGNYWFCVKLKNRQSSLQHVVIQLPTHNIGSIILYRACESKLNQVANSYGIIQGGSGTMDSRFPTFLVTLEANSEDTFYLNTTFYKDTNFPITIGSQNEYYSDSVWHGTMSGLYYGFLLAVLTINFFFFYRFRDEVYLYYLIFLVSYTMGMLVYDGFLRLLPEVDAEPCIHLIMEITMFVFAFKFLDLNTVVPRFKNYAIVFVILIGVCETLHLVSGNYLFFALGDVIAMISFLLVWIIGLSTIKKVKYARFYVLGYFILIVYGYYCVMAYNFGLFQISAYNFLFKIASTVDMLIFTYAISYRMDVLSKENQKIIDELRTFVGQFKIMNSVDPFYALLKENELSNQSLTLREVEILKCLYQGLSNPEIAEKLFISANTVKFHIKNIYKKLDVSNRKETSEKLSSIITDSV